MDEVAKLQPLCGRAALGFVVSDPFAVSGRLAAEKPARYRHTVHMVVFYGVSCERFSVSAEPGVALLASPCSCAHPQQEQVLAPGVQVAVIGALGQHDALILLQDRFVAMLVEEGDLPLKNDEGVVLGYVGVNGVFAALSVSFKLSHRSSVSARGMLILPAER